mmetsp:Transcript_1008/g.1264  ORF Transcript_1008/g.1264 Transcript_1008/m.1264 type:complete len:81 (+) Transcript_1008:65-307(+)
MTYISAINQQNNSSIESSMMLLRITEEEPLRLLNGDNYSKSPNQSISRCKSYKLNLASLASSVAQAPGVQMSKLTISLYQ